MLLKILLSLLPLVANPTPQEEVREIEQQIADLEDLQEKYRSKASRDANNAMRWQFQNENYMDARRAWDQVAEDKQKIQEIQDQIDDLEARKKKIQKEHGDKKSSP